MKKTAKRKDRWVVPYFKQYKRALALALVLGVATFGFASALMFTSGYLISASAEVITILMLHFPLIYVRIFGIGKPILHYFERLTSHDWVLRMTSNMRLDLYRAIESKAMLFHATQKTGDVLGLLNEDIGHVQNLYLRTIFPTIVAWVLFAIVVATLGFFSWWIALAMLLVIGTSVILVPLLSALMNGARTMRRKELKNELYAELTDNVLGVSDWIYSQRNVAYLDRIAAIEERVRDAEARYDRFSRRRDFALSAVFLVGSIALLIWAQASFGGTVGGSANWIAAFVLAYFPLVDVFAPVSEAASEGCAYRDSIRRLNELPVLADDNGAAAEEVPADASIAIESASYRYAGTSGNVIDDLTLHIAQGEKVALLGRSGAGKSTLVSLIRGDVVPDEGSVRIGGADPRAIEGGVARTVGVIQQHTYLFNDTLFENVRIGNPEASREQAAQALERVGLADFLANLPEGLDTLVDEAGTCFSGGERHRVALARVLLQDVGIVILDEPCAGLDPKTERDLIAAFLDVLRDKTLLMITHHLEGAASMDRIVFLDDGALKRDGGFVMDASPEEMMANSPYYRELVAFDRGFIGE